MAEARSRGDWQRTAALLALTANCHRDPRRHRPYRPEDFLTPTARRAEPTTDLTILKAVFVDRRPPQQESP